MPSFSGKVYHSRPISATTDLFGLLICRGMAYDPFTGGNVLHEDAFVKDASFLTGHPAGTIVNYCYRISFDNNGAGGAHGLTLPFVKCYRISIGAILWFLCMAKKY